MICFELISHDVSPRFGTDQLMRNSVKYIEQRLLVNFSSILIAMLYEEPDKVMTLQELTPGLRCIIYTCANLS